MSFKQTSSALKKTSHVSFKSPAPAAKNPQPRQSMKDSRMSNYGYSPERSAINMRQNVEKYAIRFRTKQTDFSHFDPGMYLIGKMTIEDIMDLKEVFDAYDSTGMGVLLPNDLKLLMTQNGFFPNKKTVYEIVAQFDPEQTGGISFGEFIKAMDIKPFSNEKKKEITGIFKKYDRSNKGYIDLNDMKEINRHLKENVDDETLKLMLDKADSTRKGRLGFEDFYSVMVNTWY